MAAAQQKPKRRHHHVWQQYLKPWTANGVIWCLQNDRIFSTGTSVIAIEKDFYKLHNITQADIELINMLFAKGHHLSRKNHAHLLSVLMKPFHIAAQGTCSQDRTNINKYLDDYSSNVLEDYHASIEASFIPLLGSALKGDIRFYEDDEQCILFLNYLCTQYMRTKGIKERAIYLCKADGSADLSRVWNVMIHMFAADIGASLFVERKRRKLILIHNDCTEVPFLTGDQPAINLKAVQLGPPDRLAIYYPISPQLALLLSDVDEEPLFATDGLTATQASTLNRKLFDACYKQVFAKSRESLL